MPFTVDADTDHAAVCDGERTLIFVVPPDFEPALYPVAWGLLQTPGSSKLLDLTPAGSINADLFEALAVAWTAQPGSVPRLGVVLPFDRWVVLRDRALIALGPLAAQGVEIAILYEQQARGNHLQSWFTHGRIVHDVPAVVASLRQRWTPGATAPLVLDAVIELIHGHSFAADLPTLLVETAELALLCEDAVQTESLARQALYYLPETPSSTRANALRLLGVALLERNECQAGLSQLASAVIMAGRVEDPILEATALYQAGVFMVDLGDYAGAERRLRGTIALLPPLPDCRNLLASAHHHLAVALLRQGKNDADHHITVALELQPDVSGSLAEQDGHLWVTARDLQDKLN